MEKIKILSRQNRKLKFSDSEPSKFDTKAIFTLKIIEVLGSHGSSAIKQDALQGPAMWEGSQFASGDFLEYIEYVYVQDGWLIMGMEHSVRSFLGVLSLVS